MLNFYSASTRAVNTRRGIAECIESALGENRDACSLLVIHPALGHNFNELIEATVIRV